MRITAIRCSILVKSLDENDPRCDDNGNISLKHDETANVDAKKGHQLIEEGWAEKEGESARKAAAVASKKQRGVTKTPTGRRRSTARPGAPDRTRAELLGEELNGTRRNVDDEE